MSRLNNTIRSKIINNALKASGATSRAEALIIRRAKLADDVRLHSIGGVIAESKLLSDLAKIEKAASKLDSNFFKNTKVAMAREDYDIGVNFAGRCVTLYFNGGHRRDVDGLNFVYKKLISYSRVVITADNPLNAEFDAIELESETISNLIDHVRSEVSAMVNSVTTIKKLIEIWPESKELLPKEEKAKSTVMVADVKKLNTMIGLPKG